MRGGVMSDNYAITRIASRNPIINGRKLYLTSPGIWSLDPAHARKFKYREDADLWCLSAGGEQVENLSKHKP